MQDRIERRITNSLSKALKFSPAKSRNRRSCRQQLGCTKCFRPRLCNGGGHGWGFGKFQPLASEKGGRLGPGDHACLGGGRRKQYLGVRSRRRRISFSVLSPCRRVAMRGHRDGRSRGRGSALQQVFEALFFP